MSQNNIATGKIILHRDFGEFHLPKKVATFIRKRLKKQRKERGLPKGVAIYELFPQLVDGYGLKRWDPVFLEAVEKFSDIIPSLKIINIPLGKKFHIAEYDGFERVEFCDDIVWEVLS